MECQNQVGQRQTTDLQLVLYSKGPVLSICRLGVTAVCLFLLVVMPQKVGTFKVVGDSGAELIHLIAFPNDLLLLLRRGANANGTSFTPEMEVRSN